MIKAYFQSGDSVLRVSPKFITFSGGEEHVNLQLDDSAYLCTFKDVHINAMIDSSSELMRLLLFTEAVRRNFPSSEIHLLMPYIPYARQDRACVKGDAFSLRVFANIINSQNYNSVTVVDAHSAVSTALINNVVEITQCHAAIPGLHSRLRNSIDFIVAPDVGAAKKAQEIVDAWKVADEICSSEYKRPELLQAAKKRDSEGRVTVNGALLNGEHKIEGSTCLIVDDICDGGATFNQLASLLRKLGASKVLLYVTHGIFSKGIEAVEVDKVFTTDSFGEKNDGRVVIKRFFNI